MPRLPLAVTGEWHQPSMLAMFNKPSVFYLVRLHRNLCVNHGPIQSCCCLLIGKINLLGITILILKLAFIMLSTPLGRREGEETFLTRTGKPGSMLARHHRDSLPTPKNQARSCEASLPLRMLMFSSAFLFWGGYMSHGISCITPARRLVVGMQHH